MNDTLRSLLNEVRREIGWSIAHEHDIKRSGQLWIEDKIKVALAALEAVEAAQAERNKKIHEHAEAIRREDDGWFSRPHAEAILGLLAGATTEPECPTCDCQRTGFTHGYNPDAGCPEPTTRTQVAGLHGPTPGTPFGIQICRECSETWPCPSFIEASTEPEDA